MSQLPTPAPRVTSETKPFWDGTGEGRLLLPRCLSCATIIWYPRAFCPSCHTDGVEWIEASGRGEVYSFSITRKGDGEFRDAAPYVLAYVELDEGPRLLTNIVECDPETVAIGQSVEVVFDHTDRGTALPRFRPTQR